MASPRISKEEREWRARQDLSTLQAAQQIQQDKARLKAAQTQAQKQMSALKRVAPKQNRRSR